MRSRGQSVWLFLFFFFFLLLLLHVDASPQGSAVAFVVVLCLQRFVAATVLYPCRYFCTILMFVSHPLNILLEIFWPFADSGGSIHFPNPEDPSIHFLQSCMLSKKKNQPLLMSQRALTTLTTSSQLLAPPSETQG